MPIQRAEVGARIRSTRLSRQLSLSDVAGHMGISVATLSRIETSKQSIDVELLMTVADVLRVSPAMLLGEVGTGDGQPDLDMLTDSLAALRAGDRAQLMLAAARRRRPGDLAAVVDDLLTTLDIVRDELEQAARANRKRRKR